MAKTNKSETVSTGYIKLKTMEVVVQPDASLAEVIKIINAMGLVVHGGKIDEMIALGLERHLQHRNV